MQDWNRQLQICHQLDMFPKWVMICIQCRFIFTLKGSILTNPGQGFFIYKMSQYPYPWHYCQTPLNLDLYLFVTKVELKSVDAKFQAEVGYQAFTNQLQNYKIYGIMIKMFMLEFLSSLPQPLGDNQWPAHLTNQNFRTIFH